MSIHTRRSWNNPQTTLRQLHDKFCSIGSKKSLKELPPKNHRFFNYYNEKTQFKSQKKSLIFLNENMVRTLLKNCYTLPLLNMTRHTLPYTTCLDMWTDLEQVLSSLFRTGKKLKLLSHWSLKLIKTLKWKSFYFKDAPFWWKKVIFEGKQQRKKERKQTLIPSKKQSIPIYKLTKITFTSIHKLYDPSKT